MKRIVAIFTCLILQAVISVAGTDRFGACLPEGIHADDVVSVQSKGSGGAVTKVTVKEKLAEIKARCRKGKLVDAKGKEIYLYRLAGCWGNPPEDYREILQRQVDELNRLRKRYRVIELTCNPSGTPIH